MIIRQSALAAGTLAFVATLPLHAAASSPAPAKVDELEEVIVTAEKVKQDLQKTSVDINVIAGKQLTEEGRNRMDEILRGVPGIEQQPDGVSMVFTIRGFSGGGIAPSPNGVGVVVDGVTQVTPTANQGMRGSTLDLAQVEVARGTQNTTIGANSLSGAVTLVSNQPVFKYEAQGSLEVGDYRLRTMTGVLNMPLTNNQAVRVAYSSNTKDGYISSGAGESNQSNFRLRYRWQPNDNLNMVFTYFNQQIGGNATANNLLLATGHWYNYSNSQSIVGFNGITYPTNPATSPIFQAPVTYTFAAGSRLAPGAVPLPTTAATSYSQLCTQQGALFSATSTTTPFILSMGCPATFIALRDNVAWYDRSNPWDDGFPFRSYPNNPHRDTYLSTWSAEITWGTHYGTWTFLPSYQNGKMYAVTSPIPGANGAWLSNSEMNPTKQIEIRLASKPESRLSWLGGLFYYTNPQPEQYNINTVFPTTAPPSLTRPTVGASASTANPLTYVLPVSAGGPATLGPNQAYAAGVASACYNFTQSYCYTQGGRNSANITQTASLYGNLTWPMLDNTLRAVAGLRVTSTYRRTLGRLGGNWLTDANGNILSDGQTFFTGTIPAGAASLSCATATAANPCAVTFASLQRLDSLLKYGWNGDVSYFNGVNTYYAKARRIDPQFRVGFEYDVRPGAMLYAAYATAAQAANYDTTNLVMPKPVDVGQTTLGIKSRWLDNRLQVNFEAFDSEYKNRPASAVYGSLYSLAAGSAAFTCGTPPPGTRAFAVLGATGTSADSCYNQPFTNINGADMYSRGGDLDVAWQLTAADRLIFAMEYLQARAVRIRGVDRLTAADVQAAAAANNSTVSSNPGTVAQQLAAAQSIADAFNADLDSTGGLPLQEAPRWSGNLSYQHSFTFRNGSRLTPRADMRYRSIYWSRSGATASIRNARIALDTGNFEPSVQKAYSMYNLYLGWESADGKWNVSGYINNVTNKAILLNSAGSTGVGQTVQANTLQLTGGYVSLDAPRTMGLVLSAKY
jgi:hypothetical protein